MRILRQLILPVLFVLTSSICVVNASQHTFVISEQKQEELAIEREIRQAITSWLVDNNEPAALDCDRLVDSLLTTEAPTAQAYFIAAQVAHLRQQSEKTIKILKEVILKYPDEKAPIRIHVPIKIVGRLQIAYIYLHSGDINGAKKAYESVLQILNSQETIDGLEDSGALIMMCYLYLAELEQKHIRNNRMALFHLDAIKKIKMPLGRQRIGYDLCKSWANFESIKILRGRDIAVKQLSPVQEDMSAIMLAASHIFLSGVSGEPIAGSGKGMNIVTDTLVNRAIQNKVSQIDRDLTRLGYGYDQHHKGNLEKAEEHFSSLFQDDSFFSPIAGLSLARVKKAQNKDEEANMALDQVSKKFPGYGSVVRQVRQSWKK